MSAPTPEELNASVRTPRQESEISPEIADLRLAMLRSDVPQAVVQIDAVRADDTAIAVKVTIGLPGGGRYSHIAAADVAPDSSWSDQLAMVQATAIVQVLNGLQSPPRAKETAAAPQRRATSQAPTVSTEDDHLPEYSWNAFWQTMNQRSITRDQVEQALGKTVQEATPKEAVEALKAAGLIA